MNKPRLTARIVRGLESVHALADVNKFDDSDLYAGCYKDGEKPSRDKDPAKVAEVNDAVEWLDRLISWHGQRKKNPRRPAHRAGADENG